VTPVEPMQAHSTSASGIANMTSATETGPEDDERE
jgi:hypothetical protein